jgi:hypothetical protein
LDGFKGFDDKTPFANRPIYILVPYGYKQRGQPLDARGRRRWADVMWDEYKIVVEIDGAQHTEDPLQRWDDMERDIDLAGVSGDLRPW